MVFAKNELWNTFWQTINLASKEYSKCITSYNQKELKIVTCIFGEMIDGRVKEKETFAKMARGEMVRFLAKRQAENVEEAKEFNGLDYRFQKELSDEYHYVFALDQTKVCRAAMDVSTAWINRKNQ